METEGIEQLPVVTTTTISRPVEINRVRGFSIEILKVIYDNKGLTTNDIVSKFNIKPNFIRSYLYNLQNYYLIFLRKSDSLWMIEPLAIEKVKNKINIYNTDSKRRAKEEQKKSNSRAKVIRQITFEEFFKERPETERVVVDYLLAHWREFGVKYVYSKVLDDFAHMLGLKYPQNKEIDNILLKLEQDGAIYNYWVDAKHAWKIGITDLFISRIKFC